MKKILIDTRIWALALKVTYMSNLDPDYNLATQAKSFVANALKKDQLLMSAQLVSEIYHVTTKRGIRISSDDVIIYLNDILTKDNVTFTPTTEKDVKRCLSLSAQYNIHIWDFMVVVPFPKYIFSEDSYGR